LNEYGRFAQRNSDYAFGKEKEKRRGTEKSATAKSGNIRELKHE